MAYGGPVVFARRAHPWRVLLLVARRRRRARLRRRLGLPHRAARPAPAPPATRPSARRRSLRPRLGGRAVDRRRRPPTLPPTGSLFDARRRGADRPGGRGRGARRSEPFTSIASTRRTPWPPCATRRNPTRTIRVTIRGSEVVADEPVTQTGRSHPVAVRDGRRQLDGGRPAGGRLAGRSERADRRRRPRRRPTLGLRPGVPDADPRVPRRRHADRGEHRRHGHRRPPA